MRENVDRGIVEIDSVADIENLNESGMSCTYRNDTVSFCKECCFVCFYVVCFSVMQQVGFWNEEMLDTIHRTERDGDWHIYP